MARFLLLNEPVGLHKDCVTTAEELGISLLSVPRARNAPCEEQLVTLLGKKRGNHQELLKLPQVVREKPSLQLY